MKNIYKALFEATKELGAVHKDATGQFGQYASLETVINHVKPTLTKHGLFITQTVYPHQSQDRNVLRTQLVHVESGEVLVSDTVLMADKLGQQGQGAAITYARRYAILAIVGIPTEDDPDANKGNGGNLRDTFHAAKAQSARPAPTNNIAAAMEGQLLNWVVPFGKFKGLRVADIDRNEFINFATWLSNDSKKQNKPLTGNAETLVHIASSLAAEQANSDFAPGDVPF